MRAEFDSHIEKMLDAGLIEKSISEWQSPIIMVRKNDRSYRFSVDFPITHFEDVLDTLGEAKAKIFPLHF